jgi:hypothetical protein
MRNRLLCVVILCLTLVCLFAVASRWPEAQAQRPGREARVARNAYELRTFRGELTVTAIRFKPETGETWVDDLTTQGGWEKIEEPEKIPAGDYEVVLTPPTKDGKCAVYRIDHAAGTTWVLGEKKWAGIPEPKK